MNAKLIMHYPPHDGDGFERQEPRIANFVVDDAVEHFLFVVAGEGRLADQHLKDEHAQTPPVDGARVRRLGEHFGRQEFRSAAEGARPVAKAHALFAQTEVGDFHVAVSVQQ